MNQEDRKTQARRLSILLWDLNMTNKEAIEACGCNPRTLFRWLAGESPIPKSVMTMFELMLEKVVYDLADSK
jgi:hypothetical protein